MAQQGLHVRVHPSQSIGKHSRIPVEAAPHAQPLGTIARIDKSDTAFFAQGIFCNNLRRIFSLAVGLQGTHCFIRRSSKDGKAFFQTFTPESRTIGYIVIPGLVCPLQTVGIGSGHLLQGCVGSRAQYERRTFGQGFCLCFTNLRHIRPAQNNVGIDPTKAEGVDTGSQPASVLSLQSHAMCRAFDAQTLKVYPGRGGKVRRHGRQLPLLQRQYGLDQPCHAGGRLQMAQIGLDRADGHGSTASLTVNLSNGGSFHRIAHRCACAVSFDEVQIIRRKTALGKNTLHQLRLCCCAGDGQSAFARTVGIDTAGKDDSMDTVTILLRLFQCLEQQHSSAFGTHIAVCPGIKGTTAAIG